jgi:leader peptidase (prepilin peptidase)/N-methyltransferase
MEKECLACVIPAAGREFLVVIRPEYSVYLPGMTNALLVLWVALAGLVLGSFSNVLILRDQERASIMTGRSHCMSCKHVLAWYDLFPLLSYLALGGRCRYCKASVSMQYPLVEAAAAGLFLFAYQYGWVGQGSLLLAVLLALSFLLFLVISVIDIRTFEIPVEYVVVAGVLGAVGVLGSGLHSLPEVFWGALVGGGALAAVMYGWKLLFHQDGMGSGDLWIGAAVGAITGFPLVCVALMAAVILGAVIGLVVMAFQRGDLRTALPFGPFLFVGLLVALQWGPILIRWYIL